jgi:hypothetical protein
VYEVQTQFDTGSKERINLNKWLLAVRASVIACVSSPDGERLADGWSNPKNLGCRVA